LIPFKGLTPTDNQAKMKQIFSILLFGMLFQSGVSQEAINRGFQSTFDKYGVTDGCFVLFNQAENNYIKHNPSLCDSGYIPASAFKVSHSMIALKEKVPILYFYCYLRCNF